MPQILHKNLPKKGELGLWRIEEEESWFLNKLTLYPEEEAELATIKGRKKLEWLASRYLLHIMSGRELRGACIKDEFGKPYLKDSSFEISLSHSHDIVAVMAAPYPIGVDIQYLVSKIERIAHKFMREIEMGSLETSTRLEHLHLYWCAKEALYKAYGRKKLDFIEHILIDPFNYQPTRGCFNGKVLKENYSTEFDLFYQRIDSFYLVYAMKRR